MTKLLLDAAGRRRSPATMPGFHAGRPPRNKGTAIPQIRRPSRRSSRSLRSLPQTDLIHAPPGWPDVFADSFPARDHVIKR